MALHDTIRARRKELGLSQEYLAEQLGISRQAVAKWEAGQSRPTAANLAALAAVLELPVSALVDPVGAQPLSSAHPGKRRKTSSGGFGAVGPIFCSTPGGMATRPAYTA